VEPTKANGRKLAQQAGQIAEMVFRSRVGRPSLSSSSAQGKAYDALSLQDAFACLEHGLT
jgi:hypothetical protein